MSDPLGKAIDGWVQTMVAQGEERARNHEILMRILLGEEVYVFGRRARFTVEWLDEDQRGTVELIVEGFRRSLRGGSIINPTGESA